MKLNIPIFVAFLIILELFIFNNFNLCYASKHTISFNINNHAIGQNNLLFYQKKISTNHDNINKKNNNVYQILYNTHTLNKINKINTIHIPQYDYKSSAYYYYNNSALRVQLENDSIKMLHIFHSYPKNIIYKRRVSFAQVGMQNLLSKKAITFGAGKRYIRNNQCVIGYNSLFYFPFSNYIFHPYSVNIGGEYWYRNFTFSLNSYLNLNKIIYSDQSLYTVFLRHPKIGYQICAQTEFPYISECKSYIKWEKFLYNKKDKKLFNNIGNENQYSLLIGIGYSPIPILDINIDNIFVDKKYINTLFRLVLNYRFKIPISQQISQKKYYHSNTRALRLNNIDSILESFIPRSSNVINYNTINSLKAIQEIVGYPGEIKFIKINNDKTLLTWDTKLFQNYGGKIIYLKNNTYAISLPKYSIPNESQISLSYDIQNNMYQQIKRKQKIFISIKKFAKPQVNTQTYDNSIIIKNDELESVYSKNMNSSLSVLESDQNKTLYEDKDQDKTVLFKDSTCCDEKNDITSNLSNNDHDLLNLVPPIPPALPAFTENTLLFSFEELSPFSEKIDSNNKEPNNDALPSSSSTDNYINNSFVNNAESRNEHKNEDLSGRLFMHKQTKFSSIGTQEYLEKLEQSIENRKRNKCISDIGKVFNKLNISLSQSSIDDSLGTSDSINSFNELSKN